jgi:hypothetical protein
LWFRWGWWFLRGRFWLNLFAGGWLFNGFRGGECRRPVTGYRPGLQGFYFCRGLRGLWKRRRFDVGFLYRSFRRVPMQFDLNAVGRGFDNRCLLFCTREAQQYQGMQT